VEKMQAPEGVEGVEVGSIYTVLLRVQDRRKARGQRYGAAVVLTLMLLAKLAGQKTVSGIAEWVRLRAAWVQGQLPFKDGRLPCANTYQYVCDHVEVEELNEYLGQYFGTVPRAKVAQDSPTAPVVHLAVDGKSLRGTRRVTTAKAATQVVGLYNVSEEYMVRQRAIASKGKERAAALALVGGLDLDGCVVSADALHTQASWCRTILRQNGDYLVVAKRNQPELREAIALLFSQPPGCLLGAFLFPEATAHTVDKQHGRIEIRRLRSSAELGAYLAPHWPGVAQVFQIERTVIRTARTTQEIAYGMTSLSPARLHPQALLALVRAHWRIENRSHWRRDATLGEDACRVTLGKTPQVLATLNNTVLALVDRLRLPNLAAAMRRFDARPAEALALLLSPI
jgi:predicted transposase YbfD/YdcC